MIPLSKQPRGPNEDAAILIPGDEADEDARPVYVACPQKVVSFVNSVIAGSQMEMQSFSNGRALKGITLR